MQNRKLGRTGLDVSAISLGTEYLINQPRQAVTAVIHAAIDQGVNYFDTFWAQPAFRDTIGAALKGYREKIITVAHLGAIWENDQGGVSRDPQVCARFFLDFLTRCQMEYVDVVYLHNCDRPEDYDALMRPGGILDLARRYQREGKARFIGFSGHNPAIALRAVKSGAVDLLMYPVNLANHAEPGSAELFSACIARNVAVVAMKAFGGGSLLRDKRTVAIEDFLMGGTPASGEKTVTITPVHCLAYVLKQPGISTIVPGCKDLAEVAAAQAYWQASDEDKDFSAILPAFAKFKVGECVYCNHCLPCPSQIDIGQTISLFEQGQQNLTADLRSTYRSLKASAADCIFCGDCEARCPYGVDVIDKMEQAATLFDAA